MSGMRIYELQELAKKFGFNTGRFLCINERGVFEFKWLDAFFGFVEFLEPKVKGFVKVDTLIELFGMEQEYLPTIGYDIKD